MPPKSSPTATSPTSSWVIRASTRPEPRPSTPSATFGAISNSISSAASQPSRSPEVIVRLQIASIAPGGEGLAHVEHAARRRAVFVPRSAPGDVIEAEVDWTRKPARATVLRLIEASPSRVEPPYPLAERCGGCAFMHLGLDAQMDAQREMVRAALAHALSRSEAGALAAAGPPLRGSPPLPPRA